MHVVQIAGASYSGSTVVGYILNANPGWFFGSEVYRMLPDFIRRRGSRTSRCFVCPGGCPYWTQPLRDDLAARDGATLTHLYDAFARRHRDVGCFVDGSKGVRYFHGSWSDIQVVTARHPLRMVSSLLYNHNDRLGFERNPTSADFRRRAAECGPQVRKEAWRGLGAMLSTYRTVLDEAPEPSVCRSDDLHVDDFAEFRRLCAHVGIDADVATVLRFSRHEVHPVGGNLAPLWQRQDAAGVPVTHPVDARRQEYTAGSAGGLGDYRVDTRFRRLLTGELIEQITGLRPYRTLCELLGYDATPPGP